jgi:hypothetical protein
MTPIEVSAKEVQRAIVEHDELAKDPNTKLVALRALYLMVRIQTESFQNDSEYKWADDELDGLLAELKIVGWSKVALGIRHL